MEPGKGARRQAREGSGVQGTLQVGQAGPRAAFCCDLGQPEHLWRGPDGKGQVSRKAPWDLKHFATSHLGETHPTTTPIPFEE